ncbi:MAG: SDR family oxidoreductase [Chloroflexota bacterium]
MSQNPFTENVVVLTGASSGIGRELAYQLAARGAWLALAARDRDRLEAVADLCTHRSGRALAVPTDVSDPAQCQQLIDRTVEEFGRIDTLINNAGITMWALFEDLQTLEPLERIMQVNYFGSVYCTHAALPHLKKSQGRLVGIASLTAKSGVPTRSGYAASKHAQLGFFDTLRIELASYSISVTVAFPDFVNTEARMRAFGADGKPLGESPVHESQVMQADECARLIIEGVARRRREVVMGRGRLLQYLRPFIPTLIDRIAARAIQQGR